MIVFVILIVALALFRMKFSDKGTCFENFLDRSQTNAIKGVFILLVFLRHVLQYVQKSGYEFDAPGDAIVASLNMYLGQFIVVMFLFYSGYGVMEAIKNKGRDYINSIPRNRILGTLLNFSVAVLCYLAIDYLLSIPVTPVQVLESLVGWESVGNSNWYIFVIMLCYLVTYLAFRFFEKKVILLCVIGGGAWLFLLLLKPAYWSNTMGAYFAGIFFSVYKDKVVSLWKKYYYWCLLMTMSLFGLISAFLMKLPFAGNVSHNMAAVVLSLLIVQLTMKIKISNSPLIWFGVNLFPLYIYQRLLMIVLYEFDNGTFVRENSLIYMVVCFVGMCIWGMGYKYWRISLKPKCASVGAQNVFMEKERGKK